MVCFCCSDCFPVSRYFASSKDINRQRFYANLSDHMSPTLRCEVALFLNAAWIEKIPFFRLSQTNPARIKEQQAFVAEVSFKLQGRAFAPWELILAEGERMEEMYIIQKGLVGYKGQCMSKGRFFAEDMIASLILRDPRSDQRARALTFVEVSVLQCSDLFDIIETGKYRNINRQIRKQALRLALSKTIIRMTRLVAMQTATKKSRMSADEIKIWRAKMKKQGKEAKAIKRMQVRSEKTAEGGGDGQGNDQPEGVIGISASGTCLTMQNDGEETKKVDDLGKGGLSADTLKCLEEVRGEDGATSLDDVLQQVQVLAKSITTVQESVSKDQETFKSFKEEIESGKCIAADTGREL